MELGKYKRALQTMIKPRGLNTVVYDDSIEEPNQSYETIMPSQAPAMDNVMPSEPGMEDPRLRQIALADGGVVEREGFAKAGPVFASEKEIESFKKEMKKKYPALTVSEGTTSGGSRQLRIRYQKKQGKEDLSVFDEARHLIPTKKNLKILREDAAKFVRLAKEKGFEKITDQSKLRSQQA